MKRKLSYLLMLVCSISVFTACTDEDKGIPIETEIVGTYKGALDISTEGISLTKGLPKNITITKAGATSVNLELKNFIFTGQNFGDINITNCTISENGDHYVISGNQDLTFTDAIGKCNVEMTGTVMGRDIAVILDIKVPKLGQDVKVTFSGAKLYGNESSEAKITDFTFTSDLVVGKSVINEATRTITFAVKESATSDQIKELVPTITVSSKATVTPASGVKQNFNVPVVYTVIAEDGTSASYTVSLSSKTTLYSFEDWTYDKSQTKPENQFHIIGTDYENPEWANCNQAIMLVKALGSIGGITYTGGWAINPITDSRSGKAVEMISVDTKGGVLMEAKVPKVTAGTIFLGSFDASNAMGEGGPMSTTSFGIPYTQEPSKVTGFFNYAPGDQFYVDSELDNSRKDAAAISAVLYEVDDYAETLDGNTLYSSPDIVATAKKIYKDKTDGYQPFELELIYSKQYDSSKKYKFTVVFSSSEDGAKYNAAIGSRLLIDEVTIYNK